MLAHKEKKRVSTLWVKITEEVKKMKRIVLIGTLLLVFVLTAGIASAQIILPPGWPFLPPIISSPVIEAPPPAYYPNPYGYYSYPYPYGYYSYPYGYYSPRAWGPGYWGHWRYHR
jgi:hypothetical protein